MPQATSPRTMQAKTAGLRCDCTGTGIASRCMHPSAPYADRYRFIFNIFYFVLRAASRGRRYNGKERLLSWMLCAQIGRADFSGSMRLQFRLPDCSLFEANVAQAIARFPPTKGRVASLVAKMLLHDLLTKLPYRCLVLAN
ncbi:MAG: hypothetical protein AB7F96_00245 [Beijerinckiaceae bacterium]